MSLYSAQVFVKNLESTEGVSEALVIHIHDAIAASVVISSKLILEVFYCSMNVFSRFVSLGIVLVSQFLYPLKANEKINSLVLVAILCT